MVQVLLYIETIGLMGFALGTYINPLTVGVAYIRVFIFY